MKPGIGLDFAIVQHVFEDQKRIDDFKKYKNHEADILLQKGDSFEHMLELERISFKYGHGGLIIPPYSTDIAAAWELVEKMDLLNGDRGKMLTSDSDGWHIALSDTGAKWEFDKSITGETPAHVICLAALKVKGVEV